MIATTRLRRAMNSAQYDRLLPVLGVATYISFFSLDPLLSVLGSKLGFEVPVGLIAFLVGFILFLTLIVDKKRKLSHHFLTISILFFTFYINTVVVLSGAQTAGDNYIMIRYTSFFAIGYYTVKYVNYYNKDHYIIGLGYFALMAVTLYALGGREYFSEQGSVNYLRVSEGVAYSGLFFIATSKKYFVSLLLISLCSISLWFSISRSSFFLFLIVASLIILINSKNKYINIILLSSVAIYLYYVAYSLYTNISNIHQYKIIRFIFQPSTDSSLVARLYFFREGIEAISANPLFGKYGWQTERLGRFGAYIHNVMSFWAQFGLYPFLSVVAYSSYPLRVIYKKYNKLNIKTKNFLLAITIFVVGNIIGAKSYRYEFTLMPIGVCSYVLFSDFSPSSTPSAKSTCDTDAS